MFSSLEPLEMDVCLVLPLKTRISKLILDLDV